MTVRILAVCGNGQGSSMIMKMKVDEFLTQSNIDHTVNSCAVGEYKSELNGADIIIASTHIYSARKNLIPFQNKFDTCTADKNKYF